MMRWYLFVILGFLGLLIPLTVASFQSSPGYMDADYYFAGGVQIADGHGFSERILWNYLDNPEGIPHPSHAYWMPMASLIASLGMVITGIKDFSSARMGFLFISAVIPPLTAFLGYTFTKKAGFALAAGFLAVFSGYYIPYYSTTDTFGIYMVLGIGFFLLLGYAMMHMDFRSRSLVSCGLGVISGLAHLSRADGILWLSMALLSILLLGESNNKRRISNILFVLLGYLVVMAPWFFRNYSTFGTILAPGGNHALWLTSYDQTFSYPASKLTFHNWLDSGWKSIFTARLDAMIWNLQTAWAVQGAIFLLPFTIVGAWSFRHDLRIKIGVVAWILTFILMTLIFPFAGSRGGFFHSGAALQPLWWVLIPVGLERIVVWLETKRNWRKGEALRVFLAGIVFICLLMSLFIFYNRVYSAPGWDSETERYRKVEVFISDFSSARDDAVLVGNPPGYFIISLRNSIAIPNEPLEIVIEVANLYGAKFIILEANGTPSPLKPVFENPGSYPSIQYLGEVDGARIYAIP
jgi:hypothetical protein